MAGCAEKVREAPAPVAAGLDERDLQDDSAAIVAPRLERASVSYREENNASFDDPIFGKADWGPPRELELTYHGVQFVADEYGRDTAAYVARYNERVFMVDSIEFGPSGISGNGHFEDRLYEQSFARSDGRVLGLVDVD